MWRRVAESFAAWISEGRIGRVVGAAAGVFLGFIYLVWGFWDMLAFALIGFTGYVLGLKSDNREKWLDISAIGRWLSDRWYR
jgi:CHASE2 domain-containing sensor protein